MCYNGTTYCVKIKHIAKRMLCGYTLGPCNAQQSQACVNTTPDTGSVSCTCTGPLVNLTVRYIGASFQDIDVTAKKNCLTVSSFLGVNTGDVLNINATDGGLLYLRKNIYIDLAGSGFDKITIPTNCCDNPVGKTFFPFEVISWTDTDGNSCGTSNISQRVNMSKVEKNTTLNQEQWASIIQYPNPADRISTFEFSVPTLDDLTLSIVNIRGQIMANVFNGTAEAEKRYKFSYDVSELQSGIYFICLNTSKGVIKKKFVILK